MEGFIGFQGFYRSNNKIVAKKNVFITEKLLLTPLYKKIDISQYNYITDILPIADTKVELYCDKCKNKRIFCFLETGLEYYLNNSAPYISPTTGSVNLNAKKKFGGMFENNSYFYFLGKSDCGHFLIILFQIIDENTIMKIGQSPSIYDMNEEINNKEFLKELGDEYSNYYKTACSLNSFNSNIGALTYLRRIFEKLLMDTFVENKSNMNINMDEFKIKRMDEKIDTLKPYLPGIMFQNGFNSIYSKISDGIHNLTEEECQEIFLPLKLAIEEILIEKIEATKKNKRILDLSKSLAKL